MSDTTAITTKGFSVTLNETHDVKTGLQQLEAAYIEHIHKLSKFNQSRTARNLGISRGTLRTKLASYFPGKYL